MKLVLLLLVVFLSGCLGTAPVRSHGCTIESGKSCKDIRKCLGGKGYVLGRHGSATTYSLSALEDAEVWVRCEQDRAQSWVEIP